MNKPSKPRMTRENLGLSKDTHCGDCVDIENPRSKVIYDIKYTSATDPDLWLIRATCETCLNERGEK